jgi:hypothetical protein
MTLNETTQTGHRNQPGASKSPALAPVQKSLFDHPERPEMLKLRRDAPLPRRCDTHLGAVSESAMRDVLTAIDEILGKNRSWIFRIALLVERTGHVDGTVRRAIAALECEKVDREGVRLRDCPAVSALVASGAVNEGALRDRLGDDPIGIISVSRQSRGTRGRSASEYQILWPTLRALIEVALMVSGGGAHGERSGSAHGERSGSAHGERSSPAPSSPAPSSPAPLPPAATEVDMLYAAYPLKVGKQDAYKAISKALKAESFDVLMEAVKAYARSPQAKSQFGWHPATWFNGAHWNDDRSAWRRGDTATLNGPGVSFSKGGDADDWKM